MATNPQAQHRCVFVGNIPYDATEEQLVQICEEVGPVVSFRLVIDRETGKPKGYGFCEYKDEETALSARRNLQGYEVNGRQLRVDFAENDKNADRNREQGRGGPGVVPNADAPKKFGGPVVPGNPSLHQPIGDSVAMAAATVMARALGSAQIATTPNHTVSQTQTMLGTDPLTRHLAKMSSSQLTEVVSELKAMATQNKEQARQLLLALPNLPKAIFQAEIMLGMVTPQMLQMPNIRQASTQPMQPLVQSAQTLPGLPPLPQNRMQSGLPPYAPESRVSAGIPNQYTSVQQFPTQSHIQRPQLLQNQVLQEGKMLGQSGGSSFPSVLPQSLGGVSVPQHVHMPTSSSFNQQMQHPLSQNLNSLTSSAMPETLNLKGHNLGAPRKTSIISDTMNQVDRASKMMKLNDGRASPSSQPVSMAKPLSAPIPTSRVEETPNTERQATQLQLPADVDSTLLQQVLSLTPQQLSSLSADQQQQVLQLQQMLRRAT